MNWEEDPNRSILDWPTFVNRATNVGKDTIELRRRVAHRYNIIDRNVKCEHTIQAGYHLTEGILANQDIPGPIVECGCFKGGMSCKLSVLCKELDKELYVFDSFQGLPHDEEATTEHQYHGQGDKTLFRKGFYHGRLVEFEMNMEFYGERSVCRVVEGFFEDTLKLFDIHPSFVFIDVDLTSSAKTCIQHFWPRLKGTRFYTHEACWDSYMDAILDENWWQTVMNEPVPECVGRYGFVDDRCTAYLVKQHGSKQS